MIQLTDTQIDHIQRRLEVVQLRNEELREELLDHICCTVESKMAMGQAFAEAVSETFDAFPEAEMQDIQHTIASIHSTKPYLAMKILLFSLFSLLLVNGWYSNFHEFEEASGSEPRLLDTRALESWSSQLLIEPPSIFPIQERTRISSSFGMRIHPVLKTKKLHRGIDFVAPMHTPVRATSSGKVLTTKQDADGYGNHIILQHDTAYQTLYAHLASIKVKEGQTVEKGDVIGTVGNSGKSYGPHLHYEVLKNGKAENPELYLPR